MTDTRGAHGTMLLFTLPCALLLLPAATDGRTVKYQTYEEDAPATVIGHLAKDASAKATFRMMKQFNSSSVRLRESDGQLTIGERIDREKICGRAVQCLVAFDVVSFSKEQFRLIHVEVEVKDINDHSPEFPRKESTLEMSENTAVGTRVPLDVAVDEDVGSNYIQSYQISVNSHFTIDVLSRADGVKYAELVLMKELDRETQASYALELVATDGGTPPRSGSTRVSVTVKDYNDNSPAFERSSYSVELPEDAPVGTLLLDLNAADPDEGPNGEVVYGFGAQVPSEIRQLFKVDRRSGRVTLESPVDYESKKTYEFDVQASDLGPGPSPTSCKVVVRVRDVNDNAPEISITPMTSITAGIAYITEAAAKDSFVALVSTADRDSGANGRVRCALHGHEHFRLQQAYEDSHMIVTTAPLDRESIAEYNLTVVAEDLGSPPFRAVTHYTIRLSDENDNAPAFGQATYDVALAENNAPGSHIATVEARDPDWAHNGKVTYRLADAYVMGAPLATFVSLDPATGALYALRSFNYEVLKRLELRVHASDGGSPPLHGSASVRLTIVDQNDNAPAITQPLLTNGSAEVTLPRRAPAGYVVTQVVARDADEGVNSELSYKITAGDAAVFSIDAASGEVYLNRELGHDADGDLSVTVAVGDNGRPSLTSTATIHFAVVAGAPPGGRAVSTHHAEWDLSVVIICVLAGSCTLLLLAIILIATTCNRRKSKKPDAHGGSLQTAGETCSISTQDGADATCHVYEPPSKIRGAKIEGYSTLPGYGKEGVRPVTVWKGNSFTTICARDPQFSGKDSGKGDSDFNDSDSDTSGDGVKKDVAQNGLWACTSECKILGHSDRCWSPTAVRAHAVGPTHAHSNAHHQQQQQQHLSTFSSTASLPRENYYQAHIPKTVGLQSVYEKVLHREYDYMLVSPPRDVSIPVYAPGAGDDV
ncbi:protocadherin-8-like [Denticeps clupeoides]|uniref:Protocadherin-8 n=1 Tax=Denticeps clupeoides TaxID=299321 RepID=A0AAY4AR20_9TELE|nr:protocadherin-8 [Denticeps clupeoides]